MSRLFTVKDFITYNNPCFSCSNQITFKIGFLDLETKADVSYLRPTVTPTHTEINLSITYRNSLTLRISHETNKITTNNSQGLTKYLSGHKLFLYSVCDRCYTRIESHYLDFHTNKGLVGAVGISSERLMVSDEDNLYQINSSFLAEKSILVVDRLDKTRPLSPITLELPLMPKHRFRDKQHLIEKMKLYVLFS